MCDKGKNKNINILPATVTDVKDNKYILKTGDGTIYELPVGMVEINDGMMIPLDSQNYLQLIVATNDNLSEDELPSTPNSSRVVNERKKWFSNAVRCLISAYKENKNLFKSNSIKADEVWENVKTKMEKENFNFSVEQIKTKFSKLKQKYVKGKDNNNKTGAAPMEFSFMEEFDDLFEKEHFVKPIAIACSSKYRPLSDDSDSETVIPKKNA